MIVKVSRKPDHTIAVLEDHHLRYFDCFWMDAEQGLGFSYVDRKEDAFRLTKAEAINLATILDMHCARLGVTIVLAIEEV